MVPGEALLVWHYIDDVQYHATVLDSGDLVGPYRHDDPNGAPWESLVDQAFSASVIAVSYTNDGSSVTCTSADEYEIGSLPGM